MRELARKHPDWHFAWIDVEDEDDAMGDTEIVTFPTVLIAQGTEPRFFGPVPPSGPQLTQLVTRLQAQARAQPQAASAHSDSRALMARLTPLLPAAAL